MENIDKIAADVIAFVKAPSEQGDNLLRFLAEDPELAERITDRIREIRTRLY